MRSSCVSYNGWPVLQAHGLWEARSQVTHHAAVEWPGTEASCFGSALFFKGTVNPASFPDK